MICLFALAFIILDVVTGIGKAFATGTFKSYGMRVGGVHKFGSLMAIVLGYLAEAMLCYAQPYLQSYAQLGLGVDFDLPIGMPIGAFMCIYIIFMEAGSIVENIHAINPEVVPDKILIMFGHGRQVTTNNEQLVVAEGTDNNECE